MLPIRCFTCNKPIGRYEDRYESLLKEYSDDRAKVLDLLGMDRYCCRRMFVSNVSFVDKQLNYYVLNTKK